MMKWSARFWPTRFTAEAPVARTSTRSSMRFQIMRALAEIWDSRPLQASDLALCQSRTSQGQVLSEESTACSLWRWSCMRTHIQLQRTVENERERISESGGPPLETVEVPTRPKGAL